MNSGSHYTVLARRFRPQAFDDVVGQEHVSRALRNAIRAGRVAHAYLFTGARGVGKTSTARILAKALNCPNVQDGVPCNNCEICDGISAGNDVDVLEIDGASNRGIDDIRSLRANVNVRSMRTQFKLYIIDEVHMLTREAFNALLKTLEEPPPNVKFVFCTTEPNKVPDTILSRCQRFDFSAIGEESIGQRLKEIAQAEGFEVEDAAVELVARRARGSMRDSQSLFDQLLAFSDTVVTAADVHRMLGTADDDLLVSLFDSITQHRPGEVLNALDAALNSGVQAGELLDQCVGYTRDLMVLLSGGASVSLCSVSSGRREQLVEQAQKMAMPNVLAAFQILSEARNRMFRSTFSRVLVEMALVQLTMLENLSAVSSLLSGELPALPAASTATAGAEEKKNSELAAEVVEDDSDSSNGAGQLAFSSENASQILTEVISETAFTLSSALKSLQSIAISEPNRMELLLESSYDFQRRVIDQAESRAAIESVVSRLTGVDVIVSLKIVQGEAGKRGKEPQPAEGPATEDQGDGSAAGGSSVTGRDSAGSSGSEAGEGLTAGDGSASSDRSVAGGSLAASASGRAVEARSSEATQKVRSQPTPARVRDDVDPEQDAFVQQVVELFGAKVVRVTDAPVRKEEVHDE